MIKAYVSYKNNKYSGFSCTGHAGYGYKGNDIVCAAVSMLVINTANAIEKFSDCKFKAESKGDEIKFIFNSDPDEKAIVLMDTLVLGLSEVQKDYGKKFLDLTIQ